MGYEITIEPIGQSVTVREGQTVLDACLRAGVWLPHACGHGLCATCKVQLLEGEVDHGDASNFALMDFERDEGKLLACCATAQSDLVIEADIDEDLDARYLPLQDFSATVVEARMLTPTIRGLWLEPDRPVEFQAGQYVMLHVPGIGERAFSIASAPGERRIELHVRKVDGGAATTWLHEQLMPDHRLNFTAPFGRFFVRKSADRPIVLVAGGSGLSSPKSMLLDLLDEGCELPITLFHGARNLEELYYRELFESLASKHANFTYVPVLSASDREAWSGETGYVQEALKPRFANDFRGHKAYLCGPPPMIEACIATLMQGRLFEQDIHTERFFTASDAGAPARRSPLFKNI
jgi:phenol hydroxylase P5 protein